MDEKFKGALTEVMKNILPIASRDWVANMENSMWKAGFRLVDPESHVTKELYDDTVRGFNATRDTLSRVETELMNARRAEHKAVESYHKIYAESATTQRDLRNSLDTAIDEIKRVREQREEWHRKFNEVAWGSKSNLYQNMHVNAGGGASGGNLYPNGPLGQGGYGAGGGGGGIARGSENMGGGSSIFVKPFVITEEDYNAIKTKRDKLLDRLKAIKNVIERYFYIEPTVEWQNAHNLILQRVADAANMKIFPVPAQEASITVTMED